MEKVQNLKFVAERSFGVSFAKDAFLFQIKQLLQQVIFIENQKTKFQNVAHLIFAVLFGSLQTKQLFAIRFYPILSDYYQSLKYRGKHHLTAVGAVARKLCNIIFVTLRENILYQVNPPLNLKF